MIQRRVIASGRVQGVSFRAFTHREALRYADVRGFVRNLPDGRVEAVFAGKDADVLALVKWCGHGPSHAQVTDLEVLDEPVDPSLTAFHIEY